MDGSSRPATVAVHDGTHRSQLVAIPATRRGQGRDNDEKSGATDPSRRLISLPSESEGVTVRCIT